MTKVKLESKFRYEIDLRPYSPGPLSEVRIDNCKVKVGAAAPGLWVHLLDQPSQLLQGGVHPRVDLQLVLRCLTYGKETYVTLRYNVKFGFGSSSISTPIQGSATKEPYLEMLGPFFGYSCVRCR